MVRLLLVSVLLVAVGACATAADANRPAAADDRRFELLEILRSVHREQDNTGFVFMLSHRGDVVLTDFAGDAVKEHGIPIQPDSRFPVMSVTKAITGLALATAVAEGRLELDRPIAAYLPDYQGEGADAITLRQLATHTAGVPHARHPDRRALYVTHFDDAAAGRAVYEKLPLAFEPGTAYGYSSSNYNLIAAVVEAVSGRNYKTFVRERVLAPLGMKSTDFDDVLVPVPGRVRNYSYVDVWAQPWRLNDELQQVPTWDFSYNLGGGNLYSTAADLLALGNAMLDRTGLPGEVWQTVLSRGESTAALSPWALGWIHGTDNSGRPTVHITGATPGVQAALYVYPAERLVFVALANCWGRNSANAELVIGAPQRIVDEYLATAD